MWMSTEVFWQALVNQNHQGLSAQQKWEDGTCMGYAGQCLVILGYAISVDHLSDLMIGTVPGAPHYAWGVPVTGARIAQSVVGWDRCSAWCSIASLNLLWASGRGDFSLGVDMVFDSISPKLSDERIKGGLVCTHMHSIAQTQKITFMS